MELPVIDPALLRFTLTNIELPHDLVPVCRQNLGEVDRGLEDVNGRIDALKREIEELEKPKAKLKVMKDTCRGLLSPLRRIPNELIARIIRSCLPDSMLLNAADRAAFSTLRCVCQRWRTVAFSSPELWRGISAEITVEESSLEVAPRLTSWFNRAGPYCLMKLDLNCDFMAAWDEEGQLIAFLTDPSRNWVDVSLTAGAPALLQLASKLQRSPCSWNRLQHLKLGHAWESVHSGSEILFQLMNVGSIQPTLPSLRTLYLATMTLPIPNAVGTFFHPTLSTLRLHSCGMIVAMMRVLFDPHNLPCLREAEMLKVWYMGGDELPGEVTTTVHPGIRRIALSGDFPHFLRALSLPNLESATLTSPMFQDEVLRAFFRRSGTHVHTLAVRDYSFTVAELSKSLPLIRRLQVPNLSIFRDLMVMSGNSGSAKIPFPLLETVACHDRRMHLDDRTVDALVSYAEQRWTAMNDPTPLTVQVLDFWEANDGCLLRLLSCAKIKIGKAPSQTE